MTNSPQQINGSAAVLWASAFIIGALVIIQAGKLPGQSAYAEMASSRGDYSVMTTNAGRGGDADPDELVYVIDNREQVLLVYEVEDAKRRVVLLKDGWNLSATFNQARQ